APASSPRRASSAWPSRRARARPGHSWRREGGCIGLRSQAERPRDRPRSCVGVGMFLELASEPGGRLSGPGVGALRLRRLVVLPELALVDRARPGAAVVLAEKGDDPEEAARRLSAIAARPDRKSVE